MKLFLTSAGFPTQNLKNFFLEKLGGEPGELKAAMIAYIQNADEQSYADLSRRELEETGIKNILLVNLSGKISPEMLDGTDLIYVCGGNTFDILQKLRQSGLDEKIKELVKKGAIYVGVSAGSIIAGPNIEIAGWGSEGDPDNAGLGDLTGFKLAEIAVFPHFREELREEVQAFKKKVNYPMEVLTNDQLLYIENGQKQIIQ